VSRRDKRVYKRPIYQYRPLHSCLTAESYIKNFMHFRDRECVRTLRPLFVYATGTFPWINILLKSIHNIFHVFQNFLQSLLNDCSWRSFEIRPSVILCLHRNPRLYWAVALHLAWYTGPDVGRPQATHILWVSMDLSFRSSISLSQ